MKSQGIINYLEAALKGAGLRQSAIANNLANLNTPGYRRLAVQFEKCLTEAIADGRDVNMKELSEQLTRPMDTPVDGAGNDVNLEMEIGDMIKNIGMQKAYLRLLARTYRTMELAMQTK